MRSCKGGTTPPATSSFNLLTTLGVGGEFFWYPHLLTSKVLEQVERKWLDLPQYRHSSAQILHSSGAFFRAARASSAGRAGHWSASLACVVGRKSTKNNNNNKLFPTELYLITFHVSQEGALICLSLWHVERQCFCTACVELWY